MRLAVGRRIATAARGTSDESTGPVVAELLDAGWEPAPTVPLYSRLVATP